MHKFSAFAATLALGVVVTTAHTASAAGAASPDSLSIDQQRQIGEIITNEPAPVLTNVAFSLSVDSAVPDGIELRPLPSAAEKVAAQFHGYSYIAVDEQIALVEPGTCKIVAVIPRWRGQDTTGAATR